MNSILKKIIGIICAALVTTGTGVGAVSTINTQSKNTAPAKTTEISSSMAVDDVTDKEPVADKEPTTSANSASPSTDSVSTDPYIETSNPVETAPVHVTETVEQNEVPVNPTKSSARMQSPNNSGAFNTSLARQAFDLINDYRVQNGLNALAWSDEDAAVASVRAQELVSDYSHNSASGSATDGGENIAMTYSGSASEVVDGWIASPGHRRNILRWNYISAGLAVYVKDGTYYWSNNFTCSHEFSNEGDEGSVTKVLDDGTRMTVGSDGNMTFVYGDPKTDEDGWTMGHVEIVNDYGSDGSFYDYQVTAVADTGIWSYETYFSYKIDKQTGEVKYKDLPLGDLTVSWEDLNAKRAVKINVKTGEMKWA